MLWRLRILLCTRWCCDVRDALRLSGLHNTFSPAFLPHTRKKAHPSGWAFSLLFDAAVYGGRPARHPPGRCCATFKSAPGGFVLLRRALTDRPQIKQKARSFDRAFRFYLMPGSSLLSHGETPHYHRRYGVSLLSSAWGQVGPPRYSRRGKFCY